MTEIMGLPRGKDGAPVVRWVACLIVMLGVHAGAAWLALRGVVTAPEPPPALPEAVMLDLAPEPAPPPLVPAPRAIPNPAPTAPPPTPAPPTPPVAQPAPEPPPADEPPTPATEQSEPQDAAPPKPPDPAPAKTFAEPKPPVHHVPPKRPLPKAMADHQPPRPVEQHEPAPTPAPSPPDRLAMPAAAAAPAAQASNVQPSWRSALIGRLQQAKRYPAVARARDEQGVATITFTMDRQGHVLSVALTRSSGSAALDEEAVAMIHRAEPLPAVPPEMHGDTITMTAPISFVLQ